MTCPVKIRIHDDRFGTLTNQCELEENHLDDHEISYDACEPRAKLKWTNALELTLPAIRTDVSNKIAGQLMRLGPDGHVILSVRYAAADKAIAMVEDHLDSVR